ncbi:MAG: TVP38/TMEM64 family protein [Planctomycetota bacterium]|nr:MAG: TVP38/TMEM64 family protein [Planctomycetota bacterium]
MKKLLSKHILPFLRKYQTTLLPMALVSLLLLFPQESKSFFQSIGKWGKLTFFLLFIIRCFSLIGFSVLGGAASYLYGFHWGFLLFFCGSLCGATLQYYAVKKKWIKIPGEQLLKKTPSPQSTLGVFLVRICPIFPFDLVTIRLAYDAKVNSTQFLKGTLTGSFPWFVLICALSAPDGRQKALQTAILAGKIVAWTTFALALLALLLIILIEGTNTKSRKR